jgi:hypothetical protein
MKNLFTNLLFVKNKLAEDFGKHVDSLAENIDLIKKNKSFKNRKYINILEQIKVLYEFLEDRAITVIRSYGEIDHGWKITPDCYEYFFKNPNLDNSWSFQVKKENLTKVIKVIDLKLSLDEKYHYIVDNLISIFDLTME